MKKIIHRLIAASLAMICILSQSGCGSKEPVSGSDFLLNTTCSIRIYSGEKGAEEQRELIQRTFALCRQYENRLSRTVADGDIGRLNAAQGQPVTVDPSTAEVARLALDYAALSGGLFDVTVGELAELWNFSGDAPSVPEAQAVEEALAHVGYEKIRILSQEGASEAAIQLSDPQTKLDLGGIAKGYIADRAAEFLRENGVTSAILDFGGNIVCIGGKGEGKPFTIGVEKPFSAEGGEEKEILGVLEVKDMSVVTSGTYERKFYEDGTLYYHVLDPFTGYPRETDLDGVSILGPDSVDCDALSTACLMLGLEKGKALIESLPQFEAVFAARDGRVVSTEGLELKAVK